MCVFRTKTLSPPFYFEKIKSGEVGVSFGDIVDEACSVIHFSVEEQAGGECFVGLDNLDGMIRHEIAIYLTLKKLCDSTKTTCIQIC